jgi:A/G-specific adenine glycosylase
MRTDGSRSAASNWARRRLLMWARRHYRFFPWRTDKSLYRALITEVLLQQTAADRVGKIRADFLAAYPDAGRLANALPAEIERIIKPLGLYKQRSAKLVALGASLEGRSFTQRSSSELAKLPGIGPYAASAVASFIWNRAEPVIDVNSARIVARFFGIPIIAGEARRHREVKVRARELVRGRNSSAANYGLLDLGALVCRPKPRCHSCPLSTRCAFYGTQSPLGQPVTGRVAAPKRTRELDIEASLDSRAAATA